MVRGLMTPEQLEKHNKHVAKAKEYYAKGQYEEGWRYLLMMRYQVHIDRMIEMQGHFFKKIFKY